MVRPVDARGPVAEAKPRTVALGVSTILVENRWGKPVDKALRPSRGKGPRVIGGFFANSVALSTLPVDKPADRHVMKALRACNDGTRREFGYFLTSIPA